MRVHWTDTAFKRQDSDLRLDNLLLSAHRPHSFRNGEDSVGLSDEVLALTLKALIPFPSLAYHSDQIAQTNP